ncbi:hypothetical protein Tco_0860121 [Tanacetum coccineum]|uniref:Uncharacterized protein n=1 Tax=Tanacetum coccineum TaxID=301880 RepID=A0ABQ5BI01_9ASTR
MEVSWIRRIGLYSSWFLVKCSHKYAISSLTDTTYRMSQINDAIKVMLFDVINMIDVVMGKPFREFVKLEYDCAKGLMSFTRIFDNYTFQMPRTIPSFRMIGIHGSICFAEEWGRKVKSLLPYLLDSLHVMLIHLNSVLAPSGGGLILYQAYGNLYAMTEEIHVTWAQLEKKRTRLRLYTNFFEEIAYTAWRRRHHSLRWLQNIQETMSEKIKTTVIIDGNVTLVDDEGKPLAKDDSSGGHDSEDEVTLVNNEVTNFLASKNVGYGTNSQLKQWKETYENADYDFDPYDDDIYEV